MRSLLLVFILALASGTRAWSNDDAVKLGDIQVLTLRGDRMTTGRRSSPIPQLKCVGGTAATAFKPKVVQCKNMGSDGADVQWRCETDMSSDYSFGQLDVVCEGYRYPDDPYVLKGSCGLEYTLDYSEEGLKRAKLAGDTGTPYEKPSYGWRDSYLPDDQKKKSGFFFGDLLLLAAVCLIIYGIYRTCINAARDVRTDYSTTNDDYPSAPGYGGGGFFNNFFGRRGYTASAPPPPGFAPDYTQGASCGTGAYGAAPGRPQFGGFWSGAATGGLLGYMFGARNNPSGYVNTRRTWSFSPLMGFHVGKGHGESASSFLGCDLILRDISYGFEAVYLGIMMCSPMLMNYSTRRMRILIS